MRETHNMRRVDVHRKEVYFQIAPNIAGFGWWVYDKINDRSFIEFSHRGFNMRWEIDWNLNLRLNSPDQIIARKSAERVVNIVAHFYYRVESALRGGYA